MLNYLLRGVSNFQFNALPLVPIRIVIVLFPLTRPSQKNNLNRFSADGSPPTFHPSHWQ